MREIYRRGLNKCLPTFNVRDARQSDATPLLNSKIVDPFNSNVSTTVVSILHQTWRGYVRLGSRFLHTIYDSGARLRCSPSAVCNSLPDEFKFNRKSSLVRHGGPLGDAVTPGLPLFSRLLDVFDYFSGVSMGVVRGRGARMKALFIALGVFDGIVLAASYNSNRYWGIRVCHETLGLCEYPATISIAAAH